LSLLAPGWLFLGGLTIFVLVLHMRRRRQIHFPSVILWRILESTARPRRSLRWPPPSLLLALQILVVVAVVVALAEPLAGRDRSQPDHTIFLLDASASMRATDQAPSRFDTARARLAALIGARTGDTSTRTSVISVGALPHIAVARQSSGTGILPILDGLRAGDGPADWAAAAALIPSIVQDGEAIVIRVFSDGIDGGTRMAEAFPGIDIESVNFVGENPSNAGITAAITPLDAATGAWRVTGQAVTIGSSDLPVPITVLFQPDGATGFVVWGELIVEFETTEAPEDFAELISAPFAIDLELPGPGVLRLEIQADAGPHDNAVHFVLRREPLIGQVLYVGDPTLPLVAALQAIEDIEVTATDALPNGDETFDLVIVDGVEISRRPNTNVLWLNNGRLASGLEPSLVADPYVTGWDTGHALSQSVDWAAITPERAYQLPRLPGATVLVEAGGAPLVQARTTPAGREIQLSFDLGQSGWPDHGGFPVFISNVVDWLGIRPGAVSATPCQVAVPCPIEARLLAGQVTNATGEVVWATAADGAAYLLPGAANSFVPDRAGLYRLELGTKVRWLAVNAPAGQESELVALDVQAPAPIPDPPAQVWRWLLAGALALLIAETLIAGTGSEQFLSRAGLATGNPLAVRRRSQLAARVIVVVALGAAVAGMPRPSRAPAEDVVVVVSAELDPGTPNVDRDALLAQVQAAAADGGGGARAGLVNAGNANRIATDMGAETAANNDDRTGGPGLNIENAVSLATAMVPAGRPGRIVLATDGHETEGEIARTVAALNARGLAVDIKPLTDLPPGEILVEKVSAPAQVFAGDLFQLDAVIFSQGATRGDISIRRAGELVIEQPIELVAGHNRMEVLVPAGDPGALLLEVAVAANGDTFNQNNTNGVIVDVTSTPSIAIITPEPELALGKYFGQALEFQGLSANLITPEEAPKSLADWLQYDSVVLMNVPAIALTTDQQDMLEQAVQVHGRGLLILGGENSFGPGGYYETAFERMSPLSALVPHQTPQVAIVFVLDRSGSMNAMVEDVTRLDIAKQATVTAVSLLNDQARVGIVVFDSRAQTIVPLQDVKDEQEITDALEFLIPGGGTSIHPALEAGLAELRRVDASVRHIVLMSDGITQAGDFNTLLETALAERITIATVAIGGGADGNRMEQIARLSGGAFHSTADFKALPSILSQETLMLAGSPVKERVAPVAWYKRDAPFLAGLPEFMPPVHGYVLTTLQPEADLHMAVTGEDGEPVPLMASWRYGNGHVLALATHGAGAGTEDWLRIPEYPLMWSQAIRQFLPDTQGPGLHVGLERNGDMINVAVDFLDDEGAAIDGADIVAGLGTLADGTPIPMRQVRPGGYHGTITVTEPGAHVVEVAAGDVTAQASLYVGFPARFNLGKSDFDKLQALADATGGKLLLGDAPLFGNERVWVSQSGWRLWAILGLALFMVDLTIRHAPGLVGFRRARGTPAPNFALPA